MQTISIIKMFILVNILLILDNMNSYFENIIGQEYSVKILQSEIANNKISHAYLFVGASGCGKMQCAKAFIKSLEEEKYAEKIEDDNFADVKIFEPKGAQTYLIGQIKEIVADSVLAPILGKRKFYIIKQAEKLGASAANALLKTLEEPADNVCFILMANNVKNVLSTIVSRCQTINFKQIPYSQAINFVMKNSGAAKDDAKNAIDLFGGNTEKAIEFCLDQNLQDYCFEIENTLTNLDALTDWECLEKSKDIVQKANEIIAVYKQSLDDSLKNVSEVLERAAIDTLEKQNKRNVNSKQKELLFLFCACIKLFYRNKLLEASNQEQLILRLSCLGNIEQNLAYNISSQNFCDVALLKIKRI